MHHMRAKAQRSRAKKIACFLNMCPISQSIPHSRFIHAVSALARATAQCLTLCCGAQRIKLCTQVLHLRCSMLAHLQSSVTSKRVCRAADAPQHTNGGLVGSKQDDRGVRVRNSKA